MRNAIELAVVMESSCSLSSLWLGFVGLATSKASNVWIAFGFLFGPPLFCWQRLTKYLQVFVCPCLAQSDKYLKVFVCPCLAQSEKYPKVFVCPCLAQSEKYLKVFVCPCLSQSEKYLHVFVCPCPQEGLVADTFSQGDEKNITRWETINIENIEHQETIIEAAINQAKLNED